MDVGWQRGRQRAVAAACLGLGLALLACSPPAAPAVKQAERLVSTHVPLQRVTITGVVTLPASLVGNNGSSIIANNGSGLLTENGAGVVQPQAGYALANVDAVPLAHTTVFLADLSRHPVPGLATVQTDAAGHFSIPNVPVGFTFILVAAASTRDGRDAHLEAIVGSTPTPPAAEVDVASTLVTAATLADRTNLPADVDNQVIADAVRSMANRLSNSGLPDLTDRAGLIGKAHDLAAADASVASALERLHVTIAQASPPPEDLAVAVADSPQPAASSTRAAPQGTPGSSSSGAPSSSASTLATSSAPATSPQASVDPGATASAQASGGGSPSPAASTGASPSAGVVPSPSSGPASSPVASASAAPSVAPSVAASPSQAPSPSPSPTPTPLTIAAYAGTQGLAGFAGDGGQASAARLSTPYGIWVDASGTLFFADGGNNRVRKVTVGGIISTVAGSGTAGYSGDGGPATSARLSTPGRVVADAAGNLYISDDQNHCIRKVTPGGTISTVAGTGVSGYGGDGGAATSAKLSFPSGIALDGAGNLYICDSGNNRVRKVTAGGTISTVAGTGTAGYAGDGLSATSAKLSSPRGLALDRSGNLYIADLNNGRIRKVSTGGTISTVANGLTGPQDVVADANGMLYVADTTANRIYMVSTSGAMSLFAGNGSSAESGDGGAPASAGLGGPFGLALDTTGHLYVADSGGQVIRVIGPVTGR